MRTVSLQLLLPSEHGRAQHVMFVNPCRLDRDTHATEDPLGLRSALAQCGGVVIAVAAV